MSIYTKLIIELTKCTPEEAPLVEGFMRADYGTLDGLSRLVFSREAKQDLKAVRKYPELALSNAKSYGLVK
jgi:hypothetical protein